MNLSHVLEQYWCELMLSASSLLLVGIIITPLLP